MTRLRVKNVRSERLRELSDGPRDGRTKPRTVNELFGRFAHATSHVVGSPWAFIAAAGTIVLWAVLGPAFHFSDTWQLVINTGTTIVPFLIVFLIQNSQNRDARAIHLKLDELLRAVADARESMVDIEELSDAELEKLHAEFSRRSGSKQRTAAPSQRG
jgi:low affinity Fe/Cu permease